MSLIDKLGDRGCWERFYEYKTSLCCPKAFAKKLRAFIDGEKYLPVYQSILRGDPFPLPVRSEVSKLGKEKKRVVYTYPENENTVLKLLTYLMLRKYDTLFAPSLYSFRPGRNAKDAVRDLLARRDIEKKYAYKLDISNYFNSVPVDELLPVLKKALPDDTALYDFLGSLLSEPRVVRGGEIVTEQKGIMAGTPLSAFYANLYLCELDRHFSKNGIIYARYSDDMIVFADTYEQVQGSAELIKNFLAKKELSVNPDKESFFAPGEGWTFLGFSYKGGRVDIAPVTVEKLKKKMKRKSRALIRWAERNDLPREKAASAFIRIFNAKLLEQSTDNELTWALWFFPVINSDKGLKTIDSYAQDRLRCIISGRHTKSRFNVRYEQLKALGYKSLVNEYYSFRKRNINDL